MDVFRHHTQDNVAVALRPLEEKGSTVQGITQFTGEKISSTVQEPIPQGHKIALCDLEKGESVWRFGQNIGTVTAPIRCGEHVHTHNCQTRRW